MARFDPAAATAAYLAQMSPQAQAKAIAYTQGGHWLLLGGWLVSLAAYWLVLRSGALPWGISRVATSRIRAATGAGSSSVHRQLTSVSRPESTSPSENPPAPKAE